MVRVSKPRVDVETVATYHGEEGQVWQLRVNRDSGRVIIGRLDDHGTVASGLSVPMEAWDFLTEAVAEKRC